MSLKPQTRIEITSSITIEFEEDGVGSQISLAHLHHHHRVASSIKTVEDSDDDGSRTDANDSAVQAAERAHCTQFLCSIVLFLVFMLLVTTHLAVTHVFWIERTMIAQLSDKPFGEHSLK